jgi:hypothetical protein
MFFAIRGRLGGAEQINYLLLLVLLEVCKSNYYTLGKLILEFLVACYYRDLRNQFFTLRVVISTLEEHLAEL